MKRILLWFLLLALFFVTACDRYKQDFIVVPTAQAFIEAFTTNTQTALINSNISQVMSYYDEAYMNTGMSKSAMQTFYSRTWSDSVKVLISSLDADSLKYQIHIVDNGRAVDTTWVDYAKKINHNFYWIGNQIGAPAIPKQIALVQMITGTWCVSCPLVEAEIHDINLTIPNQMIYLEYHIQDSLQIAAVTNLAAYYGYPSAPSSIFQGSTILLGASDEVLNSYQSVIDNIITSDALVNFSNLAYTKNGNSLSGSVNVLTSDPTLLENCYLKAVIYEKETTALNYANHLCTNVVRATTSVPISSKAFRQNISFDMTSLKGIADDAYVVVWVQKIMDQNAITTGTDKIYNCIQSQIR